MIPAILATFLFCISAVSATKATRYLGGISANFWRLLLATILLGFWSHLCAHGIAGKGFAMFFMSGVVGFGLGDLALYQALPRLGSRLTLMLVHCVAAPSAAFAEWVCLGTVLTVPEIASTFCILFGVTVALYPASVGHGKAMTSGMDVTGVFYGLVAAVGQGVGAAMSRVAYNINAAEGISIDGLTAAYQRALGGLLLAGMAMIALRRFTAFYGDSMNRRSYGTPNLTGHARNAFPWIICTALTGPTLGIGCYQWALEKTPSGLVLPIVATTPLVVIPLSAWMEGDRPSPRFIAGGLVAVLGVVLLSQSS
ncbi:MAG: DMT family transporter [Verrucomicrobiota bacterium]|nr:DMT family transporter [Verrucomicrobiota bacterium]